MKRNVRSLRGRRKEGRKMEKKTMHLPQELIIDILLRLPVKSLVRFRCVCKSWFSLISGPHFARSHFELAAAPTRRLLFIEASAPETRSIDVDASLNDDSASAAAKLNFLPPQSYLDLIIGGSCRGFLFLDLYPYLYLWNPSTGVHKQIPYSPNVDIHICPYMYGFGYDPSTDDYLVVLGSYYSTSGEILIKLEFFSLRANTWKEIEGAHSPCMNDSEHPTVGSFLDGAIHWLAYRHDISVNVIAAFDLMERRLSDIPLPYDFDLDPTETDCAFYLRVLGGFINLWVTGDDTVEIWVMREHKVNSSWTKTIVLSINDIPSGYFIPLCSTESGDIVGMDGDTLLVKYSDKLQLLEHGSYRNELHGSSQVAMYTESLLSLPGDADQA